MTRIDLSPLYRSSIGFDGLASMLDTAFNTERNTNGYPPYNIEVIEDNKYAITLAVSGFSQNDLDIETEHGVLTIKGSKSDEDSNREFLHKGIATRAFERKFNLADYVEVTAAKLKDGLLTIVLNKEIPEVMKPKKINIDGIKKEDDYDKTSEKKVLDYQSQLADEHNQHISQEFANNS